LVATNLPLYGSKGTSMAYLSMLPTTTLVLATPISGLLEPEFIIPIVAILGGLSIPIIAIYFTHRKNQLQADLIEKALAQGLSVEEIADLLSRQGFGEKDARRKHQLPFRKGLVLLAIGAAFFLAANPGAIDADYEATRMFGSAGNFVPLLLMALGVANLITDVLNLDRYKRGPED